MEKSKILIVDDDYEIQKVLDILLSKEGFATVKAENGAKALEIMDDTFDLVILDIMMPDIDGYSVCLSIRQNYNTPILFLSAKSSDNNKAMGFLTGCDDYITKPFSTIELIERVKAMLRRYIVYKGKPIHGKDALLQVKDIYVNESTGKVTHNENEITLTPIEYAIFLLLAKNPKKIFSIQNIYESVWDEAYDFNANSTVMVHINNLKKKLAVHNNEMKYITNVWGRGYCIEIC